MKAGLKNKLIQNVAGNSIFGVLGHLSFFMLLLGAVYFYKERILFADSAFQFFKIVNFEKINIEAARYGAILPEFPLLLAMKLGFGLKMLLIIYSVSFIGLYYLVFLLCLKAFKNVPAALSIVLILILCISESFFHAVTETHQSLVFSILLFAILQHSFRYSLVRFLLAAAVILLAFFTHPVALYTLVFVIGYSAIDKNQLRKVSPYLLLLLVVGIAAAKVMLTDQNSYEGKFFSELLKSPANIFKLPEAHSTRFLLSRVFGLYLWVFVFELMLIIFLIAKKEYLKLLWQLGILGSFLLITLLTYNVGDSDMMMERAFMPLALFVTVPFLKELLEDNQQFRHLKLLLLAVVIVFSMNRIYGQGNAFRERIRFNQELLAKTAKLPNRKFIIQSGELQKRYYTYWSHSFETLMLSSITANIPVQTIFPANDPESLKKYTDENVKDVFLGADFWLEWGIDNLNQKYFKLSKELPYAVVKIDEL